MTGPAMPPEVEAVFAVAPQSIRDAFAMAEAASDNVLAVSGRRPSPAGAQRILLGALARVGGTDEDVEFLIVHDLAADEDLAYWRKQYPHATAR